MTGRRVDPMRWRLRFARSVMRAPIPARALELGFMLRTPRPVLARRASLAMRWRLSRYLAAGQRCGLVNLPGTD